MTHLIILFFVTFSAAFMATVPPGLLNMNAAKTSVEKGKLNGIMFSLGVASMIMVQAYIAVLISKYLYNNPDVVAVLLKIALVVFAFFAVYFFVLAKKNKRQKEKKINFSKKSSYFKGVLLAGLNLLTIPYYSGLNAMWKTSGWINFEITDIVIFVLAAGLGTFTVLYLYTIYFYKLETKNNTFSRNSNYILSALMAVLFIITVIRIFNP
ncbi:MAG: LysE family transporter [Cellulophaga sp.]|nr:LysE family transporter [Cellulophaga sp.]